MVLAVPGNVVLQNRAAPPRPDSCVPHAIANDDPLKPDWLTARTLLSLSPQSPAFTLPRLSEPQVNIIDATYDSVCNISEAFWPGAKCNEEESLAKHPFLNTSGTVPPPLPGDTPACNGPAPSLDHSVSIAGTLAGGRLTSGRYTVLPSSFVNHARTRLAGAGGILFPYQGVVPKEADGRPVIWLVPAGAKSAPENATINSLLDYKFDNGGLHKRSTIMVVAAPYKEECASAPVHDWNWDVQGTSECSCYPACLGRVDAAIVVAALDRDGRLLERATDGQKFHLGPSMVHIAAPGEAIIAPSYSGNIPVLRYRTGVSVATAVAGAAAALYYRFVPNADPNVVKARIFATADLTDETLSNKVRFGRLNIARLMLPIEQKIDELVEENRKRVVIQEVTENGGATGERTDATKPVTVALVDFTKGFEKAAYDQESSRRKIKRDSSCGPAILAENVPRLWIRGGVNMVDLCPKLTDILRLRVVRGPKETDPPLATVVFWDRTSRKYSPVRVERDVKVEGCTVMGADAPSEIPCVVQVENGETKPLDLRGKDILFPMWFQ
jgi:hypothetical protein